VSATALSEIEVALFMSPIACTIKFKSRDNAQTIHREKSFGLLQAKNQ